MVRILVLIFAIAATQAVGAQDWPARPVRVIVNLPPGGVADVVARLTAASLTESLKQPVIVENRAGGEGYIGFEAVAHARPDGYTVLFSAGSAMMITPHLVQRKNFDPLEMLVPVAPTVTSTLFFVVQPSHPAKTLAEFIEYARANPLKSNYGSAGTGTNPHIAAEIFRRETRIPATHIPYKGAGPALNDLLGGVIEFMFYPYIGLPLVKAGKLRLLAVAGARRLPDYPDVPTLEERGINVDGGPYFGYYAPRGIPPAIAQRLNTEVMAAIHSPDTRRRLEAMGLAVGQMTPEQFSSYVRAQSQRYGQLLKDFGLRKE